MSDGPDVSDQFDRFEAVEGDARLRASTPDGESVTLPAGWFDADGPSDADWLDAYRALLDDCLPDCLSVEDGAARVPRANALAALRDAEDLTPRAAAALLAYFDAEGVVERREESVAVLFDPAADRPLTDERWRVAADALAAELERLVGDANARQAREREREIEAELEAVAEEIRDLTPGDDVPDPDDLDDDQHERFRELKEEFAYYKQLQAANSDPPLAVHESVANLSRARLTVAPDSLAAFESLVEAAAALRDATENGAVDDVADCLDRLGRRLDEVADYPDGE